HVRPVAQFTLYRSRAHGGGEAQAVEADVLRIGEKVARIGRAEARRGQWIGSAADDRITERHAAVVVHVVQAELGVIQLGDEPAQRNAELATVAGIAVAATWHV